VLPDGVTFFSKPFYPADLLREAGVPAHAGWRAAH